MSSIYKLMATITLSASMSLFSGCGGKNDDSSKSSPVGTNSNPAPASNPTPAVNGTPTTNAMPTENAPVTSEANVSATQLYNLYNGSWKVLSANYIGDSMNGEGPLRVETYAPNNNLRGSHILFNFTDRSITVERPCFTQSPEVNRHRATSAVEYSGNTFKVPAVYLEPRSACLSASSLRIYPGTYVIRRLSDSDQIEVLLPNNRGRMILAEYIPEPAPTPVAPPVVAEQPSEPAVIAEGPRSSCHNNPRQEAFARNIAIDSMTLVPNRNKVIEIIERVREQSIRNNRFTPGTDSGDYRFEFAYNSQGELIGLVSISPVNSRLHVRPEIFNGLISGISYGINNSLVNEYRRVVTQIPAWLTLRCGEGTIPFEMRL